MHILSQQHSYIGSLICGIIQVSPLDILVLYSSLTTCQVIALVAYVVGYFPGVATSTHSH
jgi:hypothetical protein